MRSVVAFIATGTGIEDHFAADVFSLFIIHRIPVRSGIALACTHLRIAFFFS